MLFDFSSLNNGFIDFFKELSLNLSRFQTGDSSGKDTAPWERLKKVFESFAGAVPVFPDFSKTLSDFFARQYEDLAQGYTMPRFGLHREKEREYLTLLHAYHTLIKETAQMQSFYSSAFSEALESFRGRMSQVSQSGQQITQLKELVQLMTDSVDGVLTQKTQNPDFLILQGNYMRAVTAYKRAHDRYCKIFADAYGLVSREEIDRLHYRNYQHNKDFQALKKTLAQRTPSQLPHPSEPYNTLHLKLEAVMKRLTILEQSLGVVGDGLQGAPKTQKTKKTKRGKA